MIEEFMLAANISSAERIYKDFPDCAMYVTFCSEKVSVVDPHWFQCGSGSSIFWSMRIRMRIKGFDDQKLKRNYSWKNLLIPGLHKGRFKREHPEL
jgi:hypothetical protein